MVSALRKEIDNLRRSLDPTLVHSASGARAARLSPPTGTRSGGSGRGPRGGSGSSSSSKWGSKASTRVREAMALVDAALSVARAADVGSLSADQQRQLLQLHAEQEQLQARAAALAARQAQLQSLWEQHLAGELAGSGGDGGRATVASPRGSSSSSRRRNAARSRGRQPRTVELPKAAAALQNAATQ